MGFKLASLFVTVEAQTARFAAQMSGIKKTASDAGKDVAGTSFSPEAGQLDTILGGLPAQLARAMAPVAGEIGGALKESFAPVAKSAGLIEKVFGRVVGLVEKVGRAIVHYYRFDLALKGLTLVKSALESFAADFTGQSKKMANYFGGIVNVAIFAVKIKKIQRTLGLLLLPARALIGLMKNVVVTTARAGMAALRFAGGLGAASKAAGGLKNIIGEIAIAAGFVAIGFKVVEFLKKAVTGASDFRETMDKVDAVLGEASGAVVKFADDMADKFGLVKTVTLDAASGFGGLAKGLGQLKGDKLSDFSIKMTKLAADFSSFANIDFDEAQKSIKIGLTGEPSDVLKQFGVVILEARTKEKALAMGMQITNGHLTQQQKLMANAALITEGLADAQDNLEITQDSTANKARKASGQWANMATTIGASLLPIVNEALTLFGQFTSWFSRAFESNKASFDGFVGNVVVGFRIVGAVFRNWGSAVEILRLSVFQGLANIGEYFAVLGPNIVTLAGWWVRNLVSLNVDGFNLIVAGIKNLWSNFQKLGTAIGEWILNPAGGFKIDWTPMLDGFVATTEKLPDLLKPKLHDMSGLINDEMNKIMGDVDFNVKPKPGGPIKKGVGVDTPDAAGAANDKGKHSDIETFLKSLQEGVSGKGNAQEKAAKTAKEALDELKKLNANMGDFKNQGGALGPGWQGAGLA